jgi:uncharacterized membrane protein SpoIIM required for sporulation
MVNASRFRAAHEAEWERLERIVGRMERRRIGGLSDDELLALPLLYRSALSSLSMARETSLDRHLTAYLEQLCTRAYFQIYGVPTSPLRQAARFFRHGWPQAVRALWRETLVMLLLTVAGAIVGYALVIGDPAWFYGIIPDGLSGDRDPSSSVEALRATIYDSGSGPRDGEDNMLTAFAVALFTHNSQIAILAFALGFAFCVPTVLLVLYNGLMLGAFMAVFVPKGLGYGFAGWLTIHGTTEMFAIILAGAAGLKIGTAVAFPGRLARTDAAMQAGRGTAVAMIGVVVMLLVAGLLEGIGRQTIQDDLSRYAVGGAALFGWLVYFYGWRSHDALAHA